MLKTTKIKASQPAACEVRGEEGEEMEEAAARCGRRQRRRARAVSPPHLPPLAVSVLKARRHVVVGSRPRGYAVGVRRQKWDVVLSVHVRELREAVEAEAPADAVRVV